MAAFKHEGCFAGFRLVSDPSTGGCYWAINRSRSADCDACLAERNAEHMEPFHAFKRVEVGWTGPDDLEHIRRRATKMRLAFASVSYEHTGDVLVLGRVSATTIGRGMSVVGAYRFIVDQGITYRQRRWNANKYARRSKERAGYNVFTAPDWATEADRQYVLRTVGFEITAEGIQAPPDVLGDDFSAILSEAFKAYNSGILDDYLESLRSPGRAAGSWGWD